MSNYWSGKGAGSKIVIKFDKALLGDVSGNEGAFTVTGMVRNPLKYGPLTERTFDVESVERYPVAELWQDDFSGQMDGVEVGENGVVLEGTEFYLAFDGVDDYVTIPDSSSLRLVSAFTIEAKVRMNVINVGEQYLLWKFTGGATYSTSYGLRLNNNVWLARVTRSGTFVSAMGTSTPTVGVWYHVSAVYNGSTLRLFVNGVQEASAAVSGSLDMGAYPLNIGMREMSAGVFDGFINGDIKEVRVWNIARTEQQIQDNMDIELTGSETGLVGYWKFNEGTGTTATDSAGNNTGTISGATWVGDGFNELGTYTTTAPADTLPANPRLKWTEDLPTGTSITAEYAVNQDDETPPETWIAINNADLLTIPDPATGYFLWMKFTLATTDTGATPTLLAVWLEEAEAPPDTILLRFDTYNRFNDAEGDITVSYESEKGTLTGTRPVGDFTESFTPTGLEPTPIDRHDITAGIELEVDFIEVDYRYFKDDSADHIITAGITVEVDLIPVSEIPP